MAQAPGISAEARHAERRHEEAIAPTSNFGQAKALDPSPTGDPSQSPTLTAAATEMGVIMGTAAYMSPEQASGQTADKRSDIWSFGVVLYEMLTGQRLFTGKTVAHVMASVLKTDPDWTGLPTTTPQPLTRLLRRCVEKEPKRRLRDVSEAVIHLEEAATMPEGVPFALVATASQPAWRQSELADPATTRTPLPSLRHGAPPVARPDSSGDPATAATRQMPTLRERIAIAVNPAPVSTILRAEWEPGRQTWRVNSTTARSRKSPAR